MKIAVVFGTRPEIIKLSPVIRALQKKELPFFIVHSNQHYDKNMDAIFLRELNLPKVAYNLKTGSGTHGETTAKIIIETEKIFVKEKPTLVIVQGDTNTVLATALSASKLQIPIAHVEAGLRSYTQIPEETNRILTDRISDLCFAPTEKQREILIKEGIPRKKIHVIGNTIVDAVIQNLKIAKNKTSPLKKFTLENKKYILVTSHREENVDNKNNLKNIIKAVTKIADINNLKVIFPLHPRTKKRMEEFKIKKPENIVFIPPVGYLDMLILMKNARIILTDSGGIQEEACVLRVPCVTMREKTERPESVEVGGNMIAGTDTEKIEKCAKTMLKKDIKWRNPFGDGSSGEKIVKIIKSK